jgi:hypothetical protein
VPPSTSPPLLPGLCQRQARRAFIALDAEALTSELAEWAWPRQLLLDRRPVTRAQRLSTARAARDVCPSLEIGADADQVLRNGERYRDKRPMAKKMWNAMMQTLQDVGALPPGELP